jgi:hypothetical protein
MVLVDGAGKNKGNEMAKDSSKEFIEKYRPVAEQVGKEIGVSPNVLLSQWALESGWGRAVPGQNNIAGIKDFTGGGSPAKDNKLGTTANYANFADPETFGIYYSSMIKRQFPNAVGAGNDISAFTKGLAKGKSGSYFEADPQKYAVGLTSIHNSLPGSEAAPSPSLESTPAQGQNNDGLTLVPAPAKRPPPPARSDKSGAAPSERLLYGGAGAALGMTTAGANAFLENRDAAAARRAAAEESARIRVRRDEANAQTALLRQQQAAERLAAMQASGATPPAAPSAPGVAPASPQAVRIQQGTTGDLGTTGRARMTGFNTETSQLSAAEKQARANAQALKNMGIVTQDAPEFFSRQPGMTSSPSGVLYPRSEVPPPTPVGPRGPEGQIGGGRPAPALSIPSTLTGATPDDLMLRPPPAEPSVMQRAKSGLDAVTDRFKSMMRPLAPLANATGQAVRMISPPLAGASAGLDVAEILHEMRKPEDQRDLTKIGLKGVGATTGALSMFPGRHQLVTIPAAVGAGATYEYMYNPKFRNYIRQKLGLEPEPVEAAP